MNYQKILASLIITLFIMLTGCDFIGAVFKTGVGVGVFLVVAIIVIILWIAWRVRRNKTG
jgi:hypothetical protein